MGPLIFLNDMPLQVKFGDLVHFTEDTCVIFSGNTHKEVSAEKLVMYTDLCSL